jgi:hypothetical protein
MSFASHRIVCETVGPKVTSRILTSLALLLTGLCCGTECGKAAPSTLALHPLDRRPQPWQRRDEPIVSIDTTKQAWSKSLLYSPTVIVVNGVFKMWYIESPGDYHTRSGVMNLGYASIERNTPETPS